MPRLAAQILASDRAAAAESIGATLDPEWPLRDLLDILPAHIALRDDDLPFGVWVIVERSTNTVVGDIGFHGPPRADGTAEIGYSIVPSRRGRGYATEAARTLIDWARLQARVRRIVARCLPDNAASIKVLERLGFVRDGKRDGDLRWVLPGAAAPLEAAPATNPPSPSPKRARGCLVGLIETLVVTVLLFVGNVLT